MTTDNINYDELEKFTPMNGPEHHCNNLPHHIEIYLHIYNYRWLLINIKENTHEFIQFCPYCGKKLRINFKKKFYKKV